MNYSYENLPPEIKKIIEAAIDMRINGYITVEDLEKKQMACYALLMSIIRNNENLQKFLNELNPNFIRKLEMEINLINGTNPSSIKSKKSIDYKRDYSLLKFEHLLETILGVFYIDLTQYRFRHPGENVELNFLSSNLIAEYLMKYDFIEQTFAKLEDNQNMKNDISKDQNSLYYKFLHFLRKEIYREKSISITKESVELDDKTPAAVIGNQDTVSQTSAEKTITEDSSSPVFDAQTKEEEKMKTSIVSSPEEIKKSLISVEQKFIGQEEAAKLLFLNIIKNQKLAGIRDIPSGTRSIIFVDGPSGTGKTAITKDITEALGLPFVATPITNYSASGYVGGNITDILKELYVKSGGDLEKAQRGIVVLDELDKIVNNGSRDLIMKTAVQHQLLDFLGGGKYNIEVDNKPTIEFDTSKLTFVCLGALTNLRNSKTQTVLQRPIGFNVKYDESNKAKDYSITPDDLIKIGFEKELVGRFNTYVHTKDYSKDDLKKILLESKISPLIGFKTLVLSLGKRLVMDDSAYDLIAEAAYDLNTGARSLQTIINNLNSQYLEELLMGVDEEIHITAEDVKRINDTAFKEKGRH